MAARRKPSPPTLTITCLDGADQVLAEVAALDRQITTIEVSLNAQIDGLKRAADSTAAPMRSRRAELEAALVAFAEANKAVYFAKRRSRELLHGSLGFRSRTRIKPGLKATWADVIAHCLARPLGAPVALDAQDEIAYLADALLAVAATNGLRLTVSQDLQQLHLWPDEILATVRARRVAPDAFWYELKAEELSANG